tara:strand:+ start:313 stop:483 length:171 start_codon:yes stop_codon:yes gene_type:complete
MIKYLMLTLFLLTSCENIKQTIGLSGKPLSTNAEENIKMNYKITFGKIRPKEDDDD